MLGADPRTSFDVSGPQHFNTLDPKPEPRTLNTGDEDESDPLLGADPRVSSPHTSRTRESSVPDDPNARGAGHRADQNVRGAGDRSDQRVGGVGDRADEWMSGVGDSADQRVGGVRGQGAAPLPSHSLGDSAVLYPPLSPPGTGGELLQSCDCLRAFGITSLPLRGEA